MSTAHVFGGRLFFFFFLTLLVGEEWLALDVFKTKLDFIFARIAAINELEHLLNPGAIVGLRHHLFRQFFRFKLHEVAIEQEEPLQRHGSCKALFGADRGRWEIEQLQVFVELITAHLAVNGTAEEARFEVA